VTWWYFWPLMAAFSADASTATSDQLSLLSPAYKEHHFAYRKALTLIVLLTTAAWYGVLKVSALRRQPLKGGLAVGSAAVLGLAIVSLVLPYRLLFQNRFDKVLSNNTPCYITGERAGNLLLFCPDLRPVRNAVVPRTDVQRVGSAENIFTSFDPNR
jgi:hypothetical protein